MNTPKTRIRRRLDVASRLTGEAVSLLAIATDELQLIAEELTDSKPEDQVALVQELSKVRSALLDQVLQVLDSDRRTEIVNRFQARREPRFKEGDRAAFLSLPGVIVRVQRLVPSGEIAYYFLPDGRDKAVRLEESAVSSLTEACPGSGS